MFETTVSTSCGEKLMVLINGCFYLFLLFPFNHSGWINAGFYKGILAAAAQRRQGYGLFAKNQAAVIRCRWSCVTSSRISLSDFWATRAALIAVIS